MRIFRFHVWLKEDTEEFPKTIVFYWDWGCRKKHMYLLVIQHSYDPLSPIPFGQALTRSSHAAHVVCCCVTATHHIAKQLCCRKLPQGLKGGSETGKGEPWDVTDMRPWSLIRTPLLKIVQRTSMKMDDHGQSTNDLRTPKWWYSLAIQDRSHSNS